MSERQFKGGFTRPQESDDAIDRELDKAFRAPDPAPDKKPFKKQWDDDIEAELEEAMSGFDAATFDVARPRPRRAESDPAAPKTGRGQEDRQGPQQAKVIAVRGHDVFLDLGAKSEGVVPLQQFEDKPPQPGDVIEVHFDHFDRAEGLLIMTLKGAAVQATWENIRDGLIVEARVTKEIKGGLEVEVNGIRGFLPISQIEIGRVEDAKVYVNQKFKVIVTDANQREKNLVVSRRDLLEKERAEQKEKTWAELEEGQVRKGVVRSVKDFGAFVDLGGVDGLVHVSDLSWGRDVKPQDLVKLNDVVEVKVLRIDREKHKVGLGIKQLAKSPWDDIEDRFDIGETVPGKVTRIMDFGAFVEIEPGIEGLVHVSELSDKKVWRVRDFVEVDRAVQVRILGIDTEAKRIVLTMKPLPFAPKAEEPAEDADNDVPPPPRPERTVPLKGGLGDRDPNPFGKPPR